MLYDRPRILVLILLWNRTVFIKQFADQKPVIFDFGVTIDTSYKCCFVTRLCPFEFH
jgi:hypothetical protein